MLETTEHGAPIGSAPKTSAGGTQIGLVDPKAIAQVYGGRKEKRRGQSPEPRHSAVQPWIGRQRPVSHMVAPLLQPCSMFTQTLVAPAAAQAYPEGQSAELSHSRVQWPVVDILLPMQSPSSQLAGLPVLQVAPVSSWWQKPSAAHTCSEAQSRCVLHAIVHMLVPPTSATHVPVMHSAPLVQRSR